VVADAVEVFAMVDYVRENLHQQQVSRILQLAKKNVRQARPLSHFQQLTINQQCPFLLDETCLVYPARTIKCRNFHATDSSSCRASFENPQDLSILNPSITALYIAATGSSDGFTAALHTSGYDDRIYDLNGAFIEAFEDPACRRRYDKGKRAFSQAKYDND
jgi:Fe-S-cluster containining protein